MQYNLNDAYSNLKLFISMKFSTDLDEHLRAYRNKKIRLSYPLTLDVESFSRLTGIPDPLLFLTKNKKFIEDIIVCEEHEIFLDLKYELEIKSIDELKIKEDYLITLIHFT